MDTFFVFLVPISLGVVAIILALGLINMLKAGSMNRSQKLMRYRVAAQFVAIVVMVAAVYFAGKG
ncbi:MAG: twin transmembrane helix small protein [Nitratireductor sp.]